MPAKDDVMALARAFMRSRIILTAAELDIFTNIDEGFDTAERIAERLALNPRALARVLDCLVTYDLLVKKDGVYALTGEGALLSSRHPASSLPMVLHQSRLWVSWSDLTEVVRKGPAASRNLMPSMDMESRRAFIGAMHVIGRRLSEEIAASIDGSGYRKLMDVGGGSGTYTIAFLRKNPGLRALIFDLPEVVPMARERLAAEGLLDRTELAAGDFSRDQLPAGCDLALLSAIIHQNGPEENLDLYRNVFRALEPGGMILVRDHIMEESRVRPPEGAIFAINMLVNTRGGDTYTFGEVEKALEEAGFTNIRLLRSGERMDCVVAASKPK